MGDPRALRARAGSGARSSTRWTVAAAGAWLAAVLFGFHFAFSFAATPGARAGIGPSWPADARVALDPARPTLVLFAHPRCPCTRSTLEELDRLLARCRDRLKVEVLFYADAALGPGWEQSDLWEEAARIPGVRVSSDPLGATAALFGATTSGQALLYEPSGRLLFEGGITRARGHAGDNAGSDAIASFVLTGSGAARSTPVFGCALSQDRDPGQAPSSDRGRVPAPSGT